MYHGKKSRFLGEYTWEIFKSSSWTRNSLRVLSLQLVKKVYCFMGNLLRTALYLYTCAQVTISILEISSGS